MGFERPVKIRQVAVAESFNPGALYQIFLYDRQGNEHLLSTFSPHSLNIKSRLMNIYIDETPYEVSAVKVAIDGDAVQGYNAVDLNFTR